MTAGEAAVVAATVIALAACAIALMVTGHPIPAGIVIAILMVYVWPLVRTP